MAGIGLNEPRSGRKFATISEAFQQDAAYWGESHEWYIVAAKHDGSDTLTRSNFRVLQQRLEGTTAKIEGASHWLVNHIDYLIVAPNDRKALRIAIAAEKEMADYPFLDDEDWSELEYSEFWEYATAELSEFDMWEHYVNEATENCGFDLDGDGGHAIEEAREALEERQAMVDSNASSPIAPWQTLMFE